MLRRPNPEIPESPALCELAPYTACGCATCTTGAAAFTIPTGTGKGSGKGNGRGSGRGNGSGNGNGNGNGTGRGSGNGLIIGTALIIGTGTRAGLMIGTIIAALAVAAISKIVKID